MTVAITPEAELAQREPASDQRLPKMLLCVVAAMLVPLVWASSIRAPAVAAPQVKMTDVLRQQIRVMSTGPNQQLMVAGTDAQKENAQIPLSGSLVSMKGFAAIPVGSPEYSTALKCLTQAIYYEAANESLSGKRAVAQVVLNRLKHPAYPNSVCGVVYEGANARVCQFSFTCDGSLLRPPMAGQWEESRRVAQSALAGAVATEIGSATHYHADYVLPAWAYTLGKVRKIGTHIFYRLPGKIGDASVFGDRWSGAENIPALDWARLRVNLTADSGKAQSAELVPGLTVTPDVTDRHASHDVGGRLNTTTTWRLHIPDPAELSAGYRSTLIEQTDHITSGSDSDEGTGK